MIIKQIELIDKLCNLMNDYVHHMTKKDLEQYFKLSRQFEDLYIKLINEEK